MSTPACQWPNDAPFALFLSHDIDQIHDRELFRVLAEPQPPDSDPGREGDLGLAAARVLRSLVKPKPTGTDVRVLLDIEARFGFRSTFFILHDPYWSRQGPRYRLSSPWLGADRGDGQGGGRGDRCHGGYYRFNNVSANRESLEMVGRTCGVPVVGSAITCCVSPSPRPGGRRPRRASAMTPPLAGRIARGRGEGRFGPYQPVDPATGQTLDLTVLPLSVMDVTLFRHLRLGGAEALAAAWAAIEPIIAQGG